MTNEIHEQNVAYYDAEAEQYENVRYATCAGRRADQFHKNLLDQMVCADLSPDARVLELGCGTGRLVEHVARRGYYVHGIDVSEGMIEVARRRLQKAETARTEITFYDGGVLPMDDESFDAAYAILVINLIPEYKDSFQQIARVLRPGGTFVFNVPNLASVYFPAGWYVNLRKKTRTSNTAGFRFSHWFMPSEWRTALTDCGLEVESLRGEPPYARWIDGCGSISAQGLGQYFSKSVFVKAKKVND